MWGGLLIAGLWMHREGFVRFHGGAVRLSVPLRVALLRICAAFFICMEMNAHSSCLLSSPDEGRPSAQGVPPTPPNCPGTVAVASRSRGEHCSPTPGQVPVRSLLLLLLQLFFFGFSHAVWLPGALIKSRAGYWSLPSWCYVVCVHLTSYVPRSSNSWHFL